MCPVGFFYIQHYLSKKKKKKSLVPQIRWFGLSHFELYISRLIEEIVSRGGSSSSIA
jgi:hypothetical protein